MSQTIIKFNIGGIRYEVSQSLLQSYPDTMLAKCAAEQWHKDPNAETFIDRNGLRFQYVLDYLRDGKVYLPPTVAKASLISDLQYYGVENIQEDKMDDSLLKGLSKKKRKVLIMLLRSQERALKNLISSFASPAPTVPQVPQVGYSLQAIEKRLQALSLMRVSPERDQMLLELYNELKDLNV
jgi:hypothetical protein